MSSHDMAKYDEVLSQILVNEKSILGFLSTIFNFLARRTDFYYIPNGPHENMGFPPGIAEQLVIKILRSCDPKNWKPPNGASKPQDINNEIMCSTVAQEVEIVTEEEPADLVDNDIADEAVHSESTVSDKIPSESSINTEYTNCASEDSLKDTISETSKPHCSLTSSSVNSETLSNSSKETPVDDKPPIIPTQTDSDTYNGAERENYSWSQTIMELDVTIKLPLNIKSAKDLKVVINPESLYVAIRQGDSVIIDEKLPYKIKTLESFWSVSGSKLLIHLEKIQERWWDKLLKTEEPIDLSKIDCSRPMYELPEDHIAKIQELKWNQEQKMKGLPTSDDIRNIEILKKAWNAKGSPFKGTEFDPSVLRPPPQ